MNQRLVGIIYVIIATLGYSLVAIIIKLATNTSMDGNFTTGISFIIAAVIFGVITVIKKYEIRIPSLYLNICVVATIGVFFFQIKALESMSVSLNTVLYFTFPIFIVLLNVFLFRQKISSRNLISLVFSICGLILAIGIFQIASIKYNIIGVIYTLLAAFSNAVYFISIQRALEKAKNTVCLSYIYFLTSIFLVGFCLITGGWTYNLNVNQILIILTFAILLIVIPSSFMTKGIEIIGASTASIVNLLQPICTIIAARLLFDESMTVSQFLGGLLVFIGLIILVTGKESSENINNRVINNDDSTTVQ